MRKTVTILAIGTLLAAVATGLALAAGDHATTGAEEGHAEGAGTMQGMDMMPGSVEETSRSWRNCPPAN